MATLKQSHYSPEEEARQYTQLEDMIRRRFKSMVGPKAHLFTLKLDEELFPYFLAGLDIDRRAHYTCRACKLFVDRFGLLVMVDEKGNVHSPIWPSKHDAPLFFSNSVEKINNVLSGCSIAEPFVAPGTYRKHRRQDQPIHTWGIPVTPAQIDESSVRDEWHHLHVIPPSHLIVSTDEEAARQIAEKREERGMLVRSLEEFSPDVIRKAIALLKSGGLIRPEKGLPIAEWALEQHRMLTEVPADNRDNLLWLLAANAPSGFCRIRSGILGTLLQDIVDGKSVADIQRAWADKLDPAKYMRAQVAPSAGNLRQAERIVTEMEAAGSLLRRYAVRADVPEVIWEHRRINVTPKPSGPIFGHLEPKKTVARQPDYLDLPEVKMTWDKFSRTMLPSATGIEYLPTGTAQFAALVTAANPEAPPILQWDREDQRNPVSVYSVQAEPSSWNLTANSWVDVNYITKMPYHWNENQAPNHKEGILLALKGCWDTARTAGGGFLPEFLRGELREVRASLDAFARSAQVQDASAAEGCGIALMKTSEVALGTKSVPQTATRVILVFDESGSMASHHDQINAQARIVERQLALEMPDAMVEVVRFGTTISAKSAVAARHLNIGSLGSGRGGTALYKVLYQMSNRACELNEPTLIYLFTDGEENGSSVSFTTCMAAVNGALGSGRVTFGCVGPRSATSFFLLCGIPAACIRTWDGSSRDLGTVTQQVAQGISSFATARKAGRTSIDDFFCAPTSGFGEGVRLRVTTQNQRQVVILDRWD